MVVNNPAGTVGIIGAYGLSNFGDDTLMVAAHEIVRRAFTEQSIILFCRDAGYIQRILPGTRVALPNGRYGKLADIVLYAGGTQFYSFPLTAKRGFRAWLRRIRHNMSSPVRLGNRVFRKMMAMSVSTPNPRIAAIGIGLGPFVENCNLIRRTKMLFARMDYVAVRDLYSYELCKQWGIKNVSLRADLCYLPGLWNLDVSELSTDNTNKGIQKIGVITRDWPHTSEGDFYSGPLLQVVDKLRSAGKEVEFISFAKSSDKTWAKRLEHRHENVITWNPEQCSISKFIETLSRYDAFITARYHGAVFASILRKPVLCIEVEQKLRLVSELFEQGSRLWSYPFSVTECMDLISDIGDRYSTAVECLEKVVKKQNALAEKMVSEFQATMQALVR